MAERSQEIIYDKMISLCFIVINGMRLISFCGRNYRLENRERLCIKIEVEHLMNNLHVGEMTLAPATHALRETIATYI